MPLMVEKDQVEGDEAGRADPTARVAPPREPVSDEVEECLCDDCQGPARDEMWTRWA